MESMDNTHNPTVITTGSPDNDMIHKIMFDKKHIALTKNLLWLNSLMESLFWLVSLKLTVPLAKAIFSWKLKVSRDCFVLLYFALWLVQKIRTTLSTN